MTGLPPGLIGAVQKGNFIITGIATNKPIIYAK